MTVTPPSPVRYVATSFLRALSFPVWYGVQTISKRLFQRTSTLKIVMSAQNIQTWQPSSSHWLSLQSVVHNPQVSTVWLVLKTIPQGWNTIWAFRQLLRQLKSAGKTIVVLIECSDARALWMTACADKIWIQYGVELFWSGIGGRHNFYGALLEKYGVQADIEAAGEFKSFGESFTRTEPSRANRQQLESLYQSLYQELIDNLQSDSGLLKEQLEPLLHETPIASERLLALGLIEGEGDIHSVEERLQAYTHQEGRDCSFSTFHRWRKRLAWWHWGRIGRQIAMVHLEGSISDFEEDQEGIIADVVVSQLEALCEQDEIVAVVLNINSPGGSAIASDRIARAILRLRKQKKVIAYMGGVAASGGYYISAVTDWIWASPQTITGSIGVVGGKMVLGKAMREQGVQAHSIVAGGEADFLDWWSPFSDGQRERFRQFLDRTYRRFKRVVSEGRRLPMEAVEDVAQGRVWTGTQAVECGLVDHLGTLEQCLVDLSARLHTSVDRLNIVHIRHEVTGWKKWRKKLLGVANPSPLSHNLEQSLLSGLPLLLRSIAQHPQEPLLLLPIEVEMTTQKY